MTRDGIFFALLIFQHRPRIKLEGPRKDHPELDPRSKDYDQELEKSILSDSDLLARLWSIRLKAADCQLRRVVSTRFMAKAATMRAAGWNSEKIIGQLVCGWTADEKSKVGVN